MNKFRAAPVAILASLMTASGIAMAASEGNLDRTSTGTSRVSLTKQSIVQIAGVSDIEFINDDPLESNVELSTTMCVHNTAANYSVTVTSSNNAFNITNEGGNNIPYTVTWDGVPVNYGSAVTGLTGSPNTNCSSDDNATLAVNFGQENFNGAPAGTYFDTLTIALAPE